MEAYEGATTRLVAKAQSFKMPGYMQDEQGDVLPVFFVYFTDSTGAPRFSHYEVREKLGVDHALLRAAYGL